MTPENNRHHILSGRREQTANKNNAWLRNRMGLIVLMDYGIHTELHRACPNVPVLSAQMAMVVRSEAEPDTNPFKAIDGFRRAVETAQDNKYIHRVERAVADLTLEAIELQLPFIREGIVCGR